MSKKPIILGIESSCDETAASIITENEQGIPIILSNIVERVSEVEACTEQKLWWTETILGERFWQASS